MFTQVQIMLRNAVHHAKTIMKLTDENFHFLMNTITVLSDKPYVRLGIGEDVISQSREVVLVDGMLTVPAESPTAGTVVFGKATFAQEILLNEVILQGEKLSLAISKAYKDPNGQPNPILRNFNEGQLPLRSDNFQLTVTIQPGGFLSKAVMLHEIPA